MVTIVTVLRSGGEYTPDKVLAVKSMVERNLTIPHEFICLADIQIPGVRVIPLVHNWRGWYAKMEMFRPDLPEGPKFYLDLDTIIVKNFDGVVRAAINCGRDFVILRDFYRGKVNPYAMGSGLMFWTGRQYSSLYVFYKSNPIEVRGGDQVLLESFLNPKEIAYWQDITEAVCSFKVHVRPLGYVEDKYSIVCFHGQPRPWDSSQQKILTYK